MDFEVSTLKITAFLDDESLVLKWLNTQKQSLASDGVFFSHWLHQSQPGFGLVIVDERTGEFHLSQNGEVTFHIEQFNHESGEFDVIESNCRPTTHFHEFEQLYEQFSQGVVS